MKPYEFEQLVCDHYGRQGYRTKVTAATGDYGVDVFAEKENEKVAVQAKMYGSSSRKVNRQAIMELYGAAAYFDCTRAVLATNGGVLADAEEVARKLGIEILHIERSASPTQSAPAVENGESFDMLWAQYIMPLEGKTLVRTNGQTNQIVKVDWSGAERITSNGKSQRIKIEIFRYAIDRLLNKGSITRNEINQNYTGRASSGIVLILLQIPHIHLIESPMKLIWSGSTRSPIK